MGLILESTPEMGEYAVEVRRESFYLHGEGGGDGRHAIIVYPDTRNPDVGTVEILLEDIPKLRACFDAIDRARGRG
jgi:hypothetical protein